MPPLTTLASECAVHLSLNSHVLTCATRPRPCIMPCMHMFDSLRATIDRTLTHALYPLHFQPVRSCKWTKKWACGDEGDGTACWTACCTEALPLPPPLPPPPPPPPPPMPPPPPTVQLVHGATKIDQQLAAAAAAIDGGVAQSQVLSTGISGRATDTCDCRHAVTRLCLEDERCVGADDVTCE